MIDGLIMQHTTRDRKTLVTLRQYQQCFSQDSRPSLRTLRYRCKEGHIPNARKQGRTWYVEVHDIFLKERGLR